MGHTQESNGKINFEVINYNSFSKLQRNFLQTINYFLVSHLF